jgi:hypothetical protein
MRARSAAAMLATLALAATADAAVRFRTVDLVVTSKSPLAAWQAEVRYDSSRVKVLSLEGGESGVGAAWREPPHHDARGMRGGRIVLAAFVEDDARATTGRARVARLHLQVKLPEGAAADAAVAKVVRAMTVRMVAAAETGGEFIAPAVKLVDTQAVRPGPEADAETEDVL